MAEFYNGMLFAIIKVLLIFTVFFFVVVLLLFFLKRKVKRGFTLKWLSFKNEDKNESQNSKVQQNSDAFPYVKVDLLTATEEKFYKVLRVSLSPIFEINKKVRIADLVNADKNLQYQDRWKMNKKIFGKHVDFVVCDKVTSVPVFAIELDDPSHDFRKESDYFKDSVFKSAGIPLLRFKVKKYYDVEALRHCFEPFIKKMAS